MFLPRIVVTQRSGAFFYLLNNMNDTKHKIINRWSAIALGLMKYYTGKPCKRGHLSERLTCNGHCCECQAEYHKAHQDELRVKNRLNQTRWRLRHKDTEEFKQKRREVYKKYYRKHRERLLAKQKLYRRSRNGGVKRETYIHTAVISRDDALSRGLTTYYTGKPCLHGHDSPRYVSSWACVECNNARNSARNRKIQLAPRPKKDVTG